MEVKNKKCLARDLNPHLNSITLRLAGCTISTSNSVLERISFEQVHNAFGCPQFSYYNIATKCEDHDLPKCIPDCNTSALSASLAQGTNYAFQIQWWPNSF